MNMPHKFHKHKLLLDEGFLLPEKLPRTNRRFDLKHVAKDLGKNGLKDKEIVTLASKEERVIVTFNIKHFNTKDIMGMISIRKSTGIIGISAHLTPDQIDGKLCSLLTKSNNKTLKGKFTAITGETAF